MPTTANDKDLKFEQALEVLEGITEKMSRQETTLDEIISLYEEGIKFLKICQEKLAEAELKVNILNERLAKELPVEEENG